jgi:hypothetical protein
MDCGRMQVGDTDMFADNGSAAGRARGFVDPCDLIRHPAGDLTGTQGFLRRSSPTRCHRKECPR